MKITIQQNSEVCDPEITVVCKEMTPELEAIISTLGMMAQTIPGKRDRELYFIPLKEIYYFESVDNKVFFYTKEQTFECAIRLYQLEEKLAQTFFARVSKSALVNLKKIRSIRPDERGRLVATLLSNEKVLVSRGFVQEIKKKLGV